MTAACATPGMTSMQAFQRELQPRWLVPPRSLANARRRRYVGYLIPALPDSSLPDAPSSGSSFYPGHLRVAVFAVNCSACCVSRLMYNPSGTALPHQALLISTGSRSHRGRIVEFFETSGRGTLAGGMPECRPP